MSCQIFLRKLDFCNTVQKFEELIYLEKNNPSVAHRTVICPPIK